MSAGISKFAIGVRLLVDGFNRRGRGQANFVAVNSDKRAEKVKNALDAVDYPATVIVDENISNTGLLVGRLEDLSSLPHLGMGETGEI